MKMGLWTLHCEIFAILAWSITAWIRSKRIPDPSHSPASYTKQLHFLGEASPMGFQEMEFRQVGFRKSVPPPRSPGQKPY